MSRIVYTEDPSELTRYIETWYHSRHREQLSWLADLAAKVERVHAGHPEAPAGLCEALRRMIGEIEVHMKKEELILFPAIRNGGGADISEPIAVMRSDHEKHATDVEEIRRLTRGPSLPEGACRTWATLYEGIEEFIADLEEHLHLENDVLFPRFEAQQT
ncbi:hypothetical protein GCM10011367_22650 [Marinicauda pacifica]|mgnify:CR=1 FL=1|uniref:Hemerythrin-like domain-containing protein n=1 Tax=Marinicauda pacifica TaxID=1133559 RepID=A0A4S2H986_9PROT|nr:MULTISPECIES: hemerythrin domain-containing protein [Marinicauda]TGY92253.1 hypothetical protein E5162_11415 [Marinicauda pacifica]GGE47350.1 hypothetical protein GCM10011367_22650 [Marinicauda pacifica]